MTLRQTRAFCTFRWVHSLASRRLRLTPEILRRYVGSSCSPIGSFVMPRRTSRTHSTCLTWSIWISADHTDRGHRASCHQHCAKVGRTSWSTWTSYFGKDRMTRVSHRSANKTLEPTRVGAFSSAFADHVFWSRVAQLCR